MVDSSQFEIAHRRMLNATFPRARLVEAPGPLAVVEALSRIIEASKPAAARMIRVHDCLWLRMWRRAQTGALTRREDVEDVLCSLGHAN